ncbi:MAG: hypothetical protein AAGI44_07320 [Pseudomonadota bacterium]
MTLLKHDEYGATIKLLSHELNVLNMLVQEERLSYDCKSDTGEALEQFIRGVSILVDNLPSNDCDKDPH